MPLPVFLSTMLLALAAVTRSETTPAWAEQIVPSADGRFLCQVVPPGFYATFPPTPVPLAYGSFYYFDNRVGKYLKRWKRELPHKAVPRQILISSDGAFVVMIGDAGDQSSTRMLVYRGIYEGTEFLPALVNTTLRALLTAAEVARIPYPDDDRFWLGPHRIEADNKRLLIQAFSGGTLSQPSYEPIRIDLQSGKRLP